MRIGDLLTAIGPEKFFDPTDEHRALRKMVQHLAASELEPNAARDDESEQ